MQADAACVAPGRETSSDDVLVQLPELKHVALNFIAVVSEPQPAARSDPAWEEVHIKGGAGLMQLARLPLANTQRVVVDGNVGVVVPDDDETLGGIRCKIWEAACTVASMRNLQWGGQLNIELPEAQSNVADPQVGHARAAAGLQRLQKTLSSLSPLAAKSVSSVVLSVYGPCSDLGAETVAALGAALGGGLEHLSVQCHPSPDMVDPMRLYERASVDASFFAALASQQHLPHLASLELQRGSWDYERPRFLSAEATYALLVAASSITTKPLHLTLSSAATHVPELRMVRAMLWGINTAVSVRLICADGEGNEDEVEEDEEGWMEWEAEGEEEAAAWQEGAGGEEGEEENMEVGN